MKKLILTLVLTALTHLSAQAQGTIQFSNNAGTRFLVNGVRPVNGASGGPAVGSFTFGLFAGVTADSLSDQPAGPLGYNSGTGGLITAPSPNAYQLAGFAPGSTAYLQFRVWETRFGTDWQAAKGSGYFGETPILPFVLGPAAGPGTVVWEAGAAGKFQTINHVPEPATVIMMGIGLGSLLLLRRRN